MKILPNNTRAFTLVELLMAVGIIAIMTGIAIPNYLAKIREQELKNGAQQVLTDIRRTSVKAQTSIEGTGWFVKVTAPSTYQVYKCLTTPTLIFSETLKPVNLEFVSTVDLFFQKNTGILVSGTCNSTTQVGAPVQVKIKNTKLTDKCTTINVSASGTISYDETNAIVSCT
jgi:prepilin-type N-terminal cleavage/methylation domain-containing protein